jgi:SAM-dependent methyltransferase
VARRASAFVFGGELRRHHVNWLHQKVCGSERWRRRVASELLPWTLRGVELGDDLLEIGPGPGVTTDLLRSLNCRLTVLEIEAGAALALRQRLSSTNVRVVQGDGAAMPFADGSFTGVVAFTMLHHVSTMAAQDGLFSEARRVLRPGGVFAGFDGVDCLLFRLVHLGDGYAPVDPNTLGRRLQAAGFADLTIEQGRRRFCFRARRP